jgi:hypothetical protein
LFRKGGVRVEVSNLHADFFVRDLVAIRVETAWLWLCTDPAAFGEVTGLL